MSGSLHFSDVFSLACEETLLWKHCFFGTQTGKNLLKKQNVSEKKTETFFVSRKQKMFLDQMFPFRANGETFIETTMFSRLRGPS